MHFAPFLIVLGSMLAICTTAIDAHKPSSAARVGLEKRLTPSLSGRLYQGANEENWSQWANDATNAIQRLLPQAGHGVEPNDRDVASTLRPGEDPAVGRLIWQLAYYRAPGVTDEMLNDARVDAFDATIKFLLGVDPDLPHQPSNAFLANFRNAINAHSALYHASKRNGALESIGHYGISLIPQQARDAMRSATTISQLNTARAGLAEARKKADQARVALRKVRQTYLDRNVVDPPLDPLDDLDKILERFDDLLNRRYGDLNVLS